MYVSQPVHLNTSGNHFTLKISSTGEVCFTQEEPKSQAALPLFSPFLYCTCDSQSLTAIY